MNVDEIGAVESVKAASDIVRTIPRWFLSFPHSFPHYHMQYAPIGGVIESVNTNLDDQPSLLNKSPEKDGQCSTAGLISSMILNNGHLYERLALHNQSFRPIGGA